MPLHSALAGRRNKRVTIQKPVVGTDSEGSPKTVWQVLDVVWAAVETLSAHERIAAAQAQLDVTDQVTILYRADMTGAAIHNYRVLYRSRVLEIKEVIPDEKRQVTIDLLCQEVDV